MQESSTPLTITLRDKHVFRLNLSNPSSTKWLVCKVLNDENHIEIFFYDYDEARKKNLVIYRLSDRGKLHGVYSNAFLCDSSEIYNTKIWLKEHLI